MATPRTLVDSADIRGCKNRSGSSITKSRIVKLDAGNAPDAVATAAAATDTLYGVAMETIADQANGNVQVRGVAPIETGGAISAGGKVTTDATGRAVAAAPAAGTNNGLVGIALTASTGASQFIEVELAGPGAFFQG